MTMWGMHERCGQHLKRSYSRWAMIKQAWSCCCTSFIDGNKTLCFLLPKSCLIHVFNSFQQFSLYLLYTNTPCLHYNFQRFFYIHFTLFVFFFSFFRAHHNDMENIFPFLFLGAIYSMTGPSYAVARLHFLVFFLGRVVHSIAYLLALKAPTRSFAYVIAQVPCVSMAIQILMDVASFA